MALGQTLFRQGDPATSVFEVIDGGFRSSRLLPDGRRQVVAFSHPGDLIGIAVEAVHRLDCDAMAAARVRIIPISSISQDCRDSRDYTAMMLRLAVDEIAVLQDLSLLLCRKTAMERVATFLLSLCNGWTWQPESRSISLLMSRLDIADHLGMTVETVSRCLTKLRLERTIGVPDRSSVVVNNMQRLRLLAGDVEPAITRSLMPEDLGLERTRSRGLAAAM